MKIKEIEIFAIDLPLIEPFIISYDRLDTMHSIIVKITTDKGLIGYGEGVADEHVTGESRESTFQILQSTLAPQLLGENPMNMERIHDVMNKAIYGVPTAKATIDIACYDLAGKTLRVPVYTIMGDGYNTEFPITYVLIIEK